MPRVAGGASGPRPTAVTILRERLAPATVLGQRLASSPPGVAAVVGGGFAPAAAAVGKSGRRGRVARVHL